MSEHSSIKKKSKKKPVFIVIGIIAVVFIVAVVGLGIAAKRLASNLGTTVDAAMPEYNDITSVVTTSGTIASGDVIAYTTSVNATVSEVNIKAGQSVKAGDTLITFDTASLETQYNEASLSARSTRLNNQATIESSNQISSDLEQAKNNVASLKEQIANIEAEITTLQNSSITEDPNSDLVASLAEKRGRLATVLEEIQTLIDTNTDSTELAANPDYINKCNERDTLNASIQNLESILSSMPDESSTIASAIAAKSSELAELQSQLAQQEALVESGKAGVLTATQREQLNIANQLSNMQVEAAATSLEEGKAGIVADKDGIILSVDTAKGAITGQGMQLFTIASTDSIKVTVPLTKKDLETVELGQSASVYIFDEEYEGEVTYISKVATTSANGSASIDAEITILNPDDKIVIGLDAKVVIHTASVSNALTIPNLAINVDTEGTFVYAVEDGIVVKKYIETGISDIVDCEILSGIDENTMVITSVTSDIFEGASVTPILAEDYSITDVEASTERE